QVWGPGKVTLGTPPGTGDWVAFLRKSANVAPAIQSIATEPAAFAGDQDFAVIVHAADPNGPLDALTLSLDVTDPNGVPFRTFPPVSRGASLYSLFLRTRQAFQPGTWRLDVTARDPGGLTTTSHSQFTAQ